jgi:hypothetical protein
MERIDYSVVLNRLRDVQRDPLVKKMLRLIGSETSVLQQGRYSCNKQYTTTEWNTAIRSRSVSKLISMITYLDGTPMSQLFLSYVMLNAEFPYIECRIDGGGGKLPILTFEDSYIVPYKYWIKDSDISLQEHKICDVFDAIEVDRTGILDVPFNEGAIILMLKDMWKYKRVREGVRKCMDDDTSDILSIVDSMKIDRDMSERLSRSLLLNRMFNVYDEILSIYPLGGCRSEIHIPTVRDKRFMEDVSFVFYS